MARTRAQRQVYADLLERYGRAVADAFFKAIDDIKRRASLQRVTAAIEAGNIEAALDELDIDPAAFDEMLDRIRDAHSEGGRVAAEGMPKRKPDGTALTVRFDGRNPNAEAWLAQHSSELITRITEEQRQNVRAALVEGMRQGKNPKQTALDIVGRVNRVTQKREGGVLGLTEPQADYVARARTQLASADPKGLKDYLTRTRRDRRFDRSVTKAIREGKAVDPVIASNAVRNYERRLLLSRGEGLAKAEVFSALANAKEQAYLQAVESGKVSEAAVKKTWRHFGNLNPRHQHIVMSGKSVGLRALFVLPDGTPMRYPHDPDAPIGQRAGCHCQADYRIDFLAGIT